MSIRRKSHNLDEDLLRRARRVLGAKTETDTIHEALRAVLVGEDVMRDLEKARARTKGEGETIFRSEFVRQMRGERRKSR